MIIIIILRARMHPQFCIQIVWVVFVTCSLQTPPPLSPVIVLSCNNIIEHTHTRARARVLLSLAFIIPVPPFRVPHALIIISKGIIISTVTNFSIFFSPDSPRRRTRVYVRHRTPPPLHPPHTHTHLYGIFFFFIPS